MIAALFLIPSVAGLAAFFLRSDATRRALLIATAAGHAVLTATAWWSKRQPAPEAWLALDALGLLFLSITSLLFLVTSIYCLGYLGREPRGSRHDIEEGFLISNAPEAVFTGCLLVFLGMMSLVCVSVHFGLIWVAVEATTLASAPLIYFHRHHRSLEATWKYLLICSVGIALALLGNFFLAVAAATPGETAMPLVVHNLIRHGRTLHGAWLKAAFVFLIVGYGTKMGLAPLHTWLPDAHSESPSVVSALLSGALLNCAFLSILRAQQVLSAAGSAAFGQDLFLLLGLISIGTAAIFIIGQADYKRMLAYSSVEHVGILALGVGLGGAGTFGAMLHAVNHSLTKALLFLVAGNILAMYGTKSSGDVRGVLRALPASGILWVVGFLAITGTPPFGPFLSEFTILKAALDQDRPIVAALYLALLVIIFVGMASVFLQMAQGEAAASIQRKRTIEAWSAVLPPTALAILVLWLGVHIPGSLNGLLHQAAQALGGS